MRNFLLSFLLLFAVSTAFTQVMLYDVPLHEKVNASDLIVEGKVLSSEASKHPNGMIYTHHQVKVYRTFSSNTPSVVEVVTPGGRVGDQMLKVDPSLHFKKGDLGMFFLKEKAELQPVSQSTVYEVYASQQGFVLKDENGIARDVMKQYGGYEISFVPELESMTGQQVKIINNNDPSGSQHKNMPPSITGFTPDTVTAGTFTQLTINGVGFGTNTGQAAVEFRNADDGGVSFVAADSNEIISWTNNQIVVQVPYRAGTGTFRVIDQNGASSLSATALHVDYNLITLNTGNAIFRPELADVNLSGGLSFFYNTDFAANSGAKQAFDRALQTWRCGSLVNFSVVSTRTDSSCASNNGISVISFDTKCQLNAGILGRTYSHYTVCTESNPQLVDVDIIFDDNPSSGWHYGAGAPTALENDFESVALHELGHAHQIGHVINSDAVMHFNLPVGSARKSLTKVDSSAGNDVMDLSTSGGGCNESAMTALQSGNCQFTAPVANFFATPRSGCIPADIDFVDASTNNPTSWKWDFQNDGTIDATSQNPTFTYTSPGIYSVKLIASNSNGSDTISRINFIQIYKSPSASAGPDRTICEGDSIRIGGNPTGSGGTGFLKYYWEPESEILNSNSANPMVYPSDTTVFTVEVEDNNGCVAVDSMTVFANPKPDLDIGEEAEACSGDTVSLVNNGTNPAGTIYQWSYDGEIFDPLSDSTALIATVSGEVSLKASSPLGCNNQVEFGIEVNESPTVEAGEDGSTCGNAGVKLGGEPTASGGAGGYTYLWQPFSGLDNSGAANPVATPNATTTYTLTVFDAGGCKTKDTVNVEVLNGPTAEAGSVADPVCAGEPVTLGGTPTGSGGSGSLNYTWFPTPSIDTINISNPTARPEETTTYFVLVTDANGCRAEDSVEVEVLPTPTASAGDDDTLCGASDVVLGGNPTGSGGVAPLTYSWQPAGLGFPPNEPNPTANISSSTTFYLTVTGNNGCADMDSITIMVLPSLVVDAGTPDTLCFGDCTNLGGSPVAAGGSGTYDLSWTTGGSEFSTDANPKVCPANTTTYQLKVSDNAGCVDSSEVTVEIKSYQPIDFETPDSTYCENDGYDSLIAFPVGGTFSGEGVTGSGFYPGDAGQGQHFVFYQYTTGNGCTIRDSAEVSVYPNPPKPTIIEQNDTLFADPGYASYLWFFNGSTIPNVDTNYYVPSVSGSYQVRGINSLGCGTMSEEVDITVGILETLEEVKLSVYPNPSNGRFQVELDAEKAGKVQLSVQDLSGRLITGEMIHYQPGTQHQQLSLPEVAAGVYLLKIQNEEGSLTKKLVIQR